jgi:HEAT repeat protein
MLKNIIFIFVSVFTFFQPNYSIASNELEELTLLLENNAKEGEGISQKEVEIANLIHDMGPDVITHLLKLLRHQNKDVRDLTAFTLCGMEGLNEDHLSSLIEARQNGIGWIPVSIAKIGTPEAIQYLTEELIKDKHSHTQLTIAFERLGEKGIPYLIEIYKRQEFDKQLLSCVNSIFSELQDEASSAIDPLIEIAFDKKADINIRKLAVLAIGEIGPKGQRVITKLKELAANDPIYFKEAADTAIINTKSPEAVPILLRYIEERPNIGLFFHQIIELKKDGISAGPTLVQYLKQDNWDMRLAAANTMGFIEYKESIPDLIALLKSQDDWRVVFAACESLGRLKAKDAISSLSDVSNSHWYPLVRDAASKATSAIIDDIPYESDYIPIELEKYSTSYESIKELMDNYCVRSEIQLEEEFLENIFINLNSESNIINDGNTNTIEHPFDVGIKMIDGYLVGSDRGEWGGELLFIEKKGEYEKLLDENIEGIYNISSGVAVIAGLRHMGMNRGYLYKVTRDDNEGWSATKWKTLPGAPYKSCLRNDGSLFVYCAGGSVVINQDGEIKFISE